MKAEAAAQARARREARRLAAAENRRQWEREQAALVLLRRAEVLERGADRSDSLGHAALAATKRRQADMLRRVAAELVSTPSHRLPYEHPLAAE